MKERLFDQKQEQVARSLYNAGEQGRRKKKKDRNDGYTQIATRDKRSNKSRQNNMVIKSPHPAIADAHNVQKQGIQ